MRKAMILGVAVLGVASAAAVVVSRASASPALDKIVPADRTVAWLEAKKTGATWDTIKAGKAWKAFEASEGYDKIAKRWADITKPGEIAMLSSLGLPLSEQTIKRFLGQDVALALFAPADEKKAPPAVFMMKIDLLGIAKDLSVDGDWSKVWEKISKALSGDKGEKFMDVEIRSHNWNGREIRFLMIKEVFVWSQDVDALKDVIRTWKGEKPALASLDSYQAELGKLQKGDAASLYLDMKFLRDKDKVAKAIKAAAALAPKQDQLELVAMLKKVVPEAVANGTDAIGPVLDFAKKLDPEVLSVLADDWKPLDALACGVAFPDGNFFETTADCSRTQTELWKDGQDNDLLTLLPESAFFAEGSGIYDLVLGFPSSPVVKAIARSEAIKWLKGKKPSDLQKLVAPDARDFGGAAPQPTTPKKTFSREFEARAAASYVAFLAHQVGDDLAVTVDIEQGEPPVDHPNPNETVESPILDHPEKAFKVLGFAKTGTLPRIALDLVSGWFVAQSKKPPLSADYKTKFDKVQNDFQTLQMGCAMYRGETGTLPASLDALLKKPADAKTWNGPYLTDEKATKDPWGHAYTVVEKDNVAFITCLGSDGAEGGDGEAQDITSENIWDLSWQLRKPPIKYEILDTKNGGKIFGFSEEHSPSIYWARFGQRWVVGSDLPAIQAAVEGTAKGANALASKLPKDQQLVLYYNPRRFWRGMSAVFEREARRSPEAARQLDLQKKMMEMFDATVSGIAVSKDYSTVTLRAVTKLGEKAEAKIREVVIDANPEPAAWQVLPDSTFFSYTLNADMKGLHDSIMDLAKTIVGQDDLERALGDMKEQVLAGHDLEKDFVAKLGPSIGLGAIVQDRIPPIAFSGVADQLQWRAGVQDPEVLKKAHEIQSDALAAAKKLRDEANGADVSDKLAKLRDKMLADTRALVTDKAQLEKWDEAMAEAARRRANLPSIPAAVLAIQIKDPTVKDAVLDVIKALLKKQNDAEAERREDMVKRFGAEAAGPERKLDLLEKKAGDQTIYRFSLPGDEEAQEFVGDGYGFSFTFLDGFLVIGTSENAVRKAIVAKKVGKNLSKSAAFAKIVGTQSRVVSGFTHFDWNGVVDQLEKNIPVIVRNMGPGPEDLKRPEWPTEQGQQNFEKYQKDTADYEAKVREFREKNAKENGDQLQKILESCRLLGGMYEAVTMGKDGMEASSSFHLDLAAIPASAEQSDDSATETLTKLLEGIMEEVYDRAEAARVSGNEAAASGCLRTLATSEAIYREGGKDPSGDLVYGNLADLKRAKLIDEALGTGTHQGYVFVCEPSKKSKEFLWYATAFPEKPGETGNRYFFTNQAGVVYESSKPFVVEDKDKCEPPKGLTPSWR